MKLLNSLSGYGLLTILLHWLMAVMIISLFFLGDYMVELNYYDTWYHTAPWWHKSVGLNLFLLLTFRIILKMSSISPTPLISYQIWEAKLAKLTHLSFYLLLLTICISGYFIGTAKGVGIEMFSGVYIPAIAKLSEIQVDLAGDIHRISANTLMLLLLLHVSAAIKHHFIDGDVTLMRMLGKSQ